MPVYEYRCNACDRKVTLRYKTYADYDAATPACAYCQSRDLTRLISRVAVIQSGERRMASLEDPALFAGLGDDNPRALGRAMRRLGEATGEDLGDEFGEAVARLESGEDPASVEQSLSQPDDAEDTSSSPPS